MAQISRGIVYDYFPYKISDEDMSKNAAELMEDWKPDALYCLYKSYA